MDRSVTVYPRPKPGSQPEYLSEGYKSTHKRAPSQPLIRLPHGLSELTGPVYGHNPLAAKDNDLTEHFAEPPQGERIIVAGRMLDEDGHGVPNSLVELWQANAAGRYRHSRDNREAPIDPNFLARAAPSLTPTATIVSSPSGRARTLGAIIRTPGDRLTSTSLCLVRRSSHVW